MDKNPRPEFSTDRPPPSPGATEKSPGENSTVKSLFVIVNPKYYRISNTAELKLLTFYIKTPKQLNAYLEKHNITSL